MWALALRVDVLHKDRGSEVVMLDSLRPVGALFSLLCALCAVALAGCETPSPCPYGTYVPGPPRSCSLPDGGSFLLDDAGPRLDAARPVPDAGLPDAMPAGDACAERTLHRDEDGDGYGDPGMTMSSCGPLAGWVEDATDCDDACMDCHPGGAEVCEGSRDEDCVGGVDDGCPCMPLGATQPCGSDVGACMQGTQTCAASGWGTCEGGVASMDEVCNGDDDDCDGTPDEGVLTTYYRDGDGDTYGVTSMTMQACAPPTGYVARDGDCNDMVSAIRPGATEICDGTIDHDCDSVPDLMDGCACVNGSTRACPGGMTQGECRAGSQTCAAGAWGACTGRVDPVTESCNTRDDDCDTRVDEDVATSAYYADCDGDGYALMGAQTITACAAPSAAPSACGSGTWTTRVPTSITTRDCDDTRASVRPGGTEVCNSLDDDCDGTPDDGVTTRYYADCDRDTYASSGAMMLDACSAPASGPTGCGAGGWTTRAPSTMATTDCADAEARAFPGQTMYFDTPIAGVPASRDYDYDCDGVEATRHRVFACLGASCSFVPLLTTPPACGTTFSTATSCDNSSGMCVATSGSVTQECR